MTLKNVRYFPEVVDEAAEHIDEVSDDWIFCCGFDLDVVKHSEHGFYAPSFFVFVDVKVLAFLSGVRAEHPVKCFPFFVALVFFDYDIPCFDFELVAVVRIVSFSDDLSHLATLHFLEQFLCPLVLSPEKLITNSGLLKTINKPQIIKPAIK